MNRVMLLPRCWSSQIEDEPLSAVPVSLVEARAQEMQAEGSCGAGTRAGGVDWRAAKLTPPVSRQQFAVRRQNESSLSLAEATVRAVYLMNIWPLITAVSTYYWWFMLHCVALRCGLWLSAPR